MTTLELIDRLCAVTEAQAEIIREQALFIEEQLTVDEECKKKFAAKRKQIEDELDILEYGMRPIHNTATCGKEEGTNE